MFRQLLANGLYAVQHARFKLPTSEHPFHVLADLLPTSLANLPVYAAISHNLYIMVGKQQINQHAIIVLGIPDIEMAE